MNIVEAKRYLRANGYCVSSFQLWLNEGSATDQLNKVKELLGKWGNKLFKAKKEKDEDTMADIADDAKALESEIHDKGLLNKFRNNKGLAKAIFGACAVLMLAGGISNAHAAANAQPYLGGSHSAPTSMAFNDAMDDLDFYCGDAKACTVDINGDDVAVHKDGHTTHHSYTADHHGMQSNGHNADGIDITVDSQRERTIGKTHGTMFTIKVAEGKHAQLWNVFQTDDGRVFTDSDPGSEDSQLKPASPKQVAWLNNHGTHFLK